MDFNQNSNAHNINKEPRRLRQQLFKNVTLEIYPPSAVNYPIIIEGYLNKIFVGGTCVVLDTNDENISYSVATLNKTIKNSIVKLSFPNDGLELKISGKIAWTQEITFRGKNTLAIGIQFQGLSPKLRGMLFVFANSPFNH